MNKLTYDHLLRKHDLLKSDPHAYLKIHNEYIEQNPHDPAGYVSRHQVWSKLGRADLAIDDLNKALHLSEDAMTYQDRGHLYRSLGDYRKALADYDRADNISHKDFVESWGPLFRAECHARLGDEEAALADCANLKDDHWTPGFLGAPKGNKQQVIATIRKLAVAVRRT